ncbi:macro domain-containing protein [Burkholderiaceae bacterium FT117]|uniref:macro domain-containing protein n=1 Tax=Zeimonas sediminis TaxID=2944268 RepID=UPI00234318B8|nr:macro domain-containing protein [Zeimonas sediminis]MCM5570126.1 macro domain-containing protein [Zeimonas sediminis]
MIRETEGDILLSKAQFIAHGIAPQDHFDNGLALALRERWPAMVRDYRQATRNHPLAAGEIWAWAGVDADGSARGVVNLLTQDMIGSGGSARPGKATVENVSRVLKALAKFARDEKVRSLALPRLATGVGGLQWADVKPVVQQHLGDLGIPVIVYETYHAGVQADEKLG